MVPLSVKEKYLCSLEAKKEKNETTQDYLIKHQNALFECLLKENVQVFDDVSQTRYLAQTKTHIKVLPVRFTVDFKDEFANITLLSTDE